MYAEWLAMSGFRVLLAGDGEQAHGLAHATCPDVIVTDVSMPQLDGIGLATRLRADARTCDIPIIAVTAFDGPWKARMLAAGADVFLTKPSSPDHLEQVIRHLLDVPPASATGT
jgi:CheY-like chemotaxis protein